MRFRDLDYDVSSDGTIVNLNSGKVIATHRDINGYLKVYLIKDGKYKEYYVHRIVAECYLDEPPKGMNCVAHIDHNKDNNHYSNLKYDTRSNIMKQCHIDKVYDEHLKSLKKRIRMLDPATLETVDFSSLLEAAIYLKSIKEGLPDNVLSIRSNISSCLIGKSNFSYGYRWSYI